MWIYSQALRACDFFKLEAGPWMARINAKAREGEGRTFEAKRNAKPRKAGRGARGLRPPAFSSIGLHSSHGHRTSIQDARHPTTTAGGPGLAAADPVVARQT